MRYVENDGSVAARYTRPNPNGSEDGICGLTNDDGRVTIMMPHPERVALTDQNSWHPADWDVEGTLAADVSQCTQKHWLGGTADRIKKLQ